FSASTCARRLYTLSLHDALPIWWRIGAQASSETCLPRPSTADLPACSEEFRLLSPALSDHRLGPFEPERCQVRSATAGVELQKVDRKSTRLNSSHVKSSYAVFCL